MSSFFSLAALSKITEGILHAPFEWCSIQGGPVTLENAMHYGGTQGGSVQVADFALARYPITNAQYDALPRPSQWIRQPALVGILRRPPSSGAATIPTRSPRPLKARIYRARG